MKRVKWMMPSGTWNAPLKLSLPIRSDIFSRVLAAEPNDFVSNVGMSIIRDEESKMDDAIWHMERAFETQPSNQIGCFLAGGGRRAERFCLECRHEYHP